MRLSEIAPIRPKRPGELRVAALRQAADQASDAVRLERERQRIRQAQTALGKLQRSKTR